ncbi:hypothetical protein L211DRAFT_463983 [Terfezia boudieri ATCC MYA-4762]|uniref:Uncharacterized protein n=1 Tax=Terfezia boudieri ATCC MYA-4762 TaxID=1051890 RepID=A0A3N4LE75_9PEZI|nr:hypothetical protein L211DRAFT_463983 [Terfezia boudieri ATCC MYA-4762]
MHAGLLIQASPRLSSTRSRPAWAWLTAGLAGPIKILAPPWNPCADLLRLLASRIPYISPQDVTQTMPYDQLSYCPRCLTYANVKSFLSLCRTRVDLISASIPDLGVRYTWMRS